MKQLRVLDSSEPAIYFTTYITLFDFHLELLSTSLGCQTARHFDPPYAGFQHFPYHHLLEERDLLRSTRMLATSIKRGD